MKKPINSIIVLGGGVAGWFTAAYLKKFNKHLDVTLIESPNVPILGVGESMLPQLGEMLSELDIDENKWLAGVHGIHKMGNQFVGWNTETPMETVHDHWNAKKKYKNYSSFSYTNKTDTFRNTLYHSRNENDYLYDNNGNLGIDNKSRDYWYHLVNTGKYDWHQQGEYTMAQYYPSMNNRAALYDDGYPLVGDYGAYTWHTDASRFPKMIRELSALPLGVIWKQDHVKGIHKDGGGYIRELSLKSGERVSADLYLDATGFNKVLMKTMGVKWKSIKQQPTQSAWVAPVKYKDPYKEMRPYTQSYARKAGWQFIITLFSRMGTGYIFDANSYDKDQAREDFIKYWDGYEFMAEPRFLSWDQGYYEKSWEKNVMAIGMSSGFVDPMEANVIYVAQAGIQMLNKVLNRNKGKVIEENTKDYVSEELNKLQNQIDDFICYHYTLSKRRDTDFWRKWGQYGIDNNHREKNWEEYRSARNYLGSNLFLDYQWADQQMYLDQWDADLYKLNIDPTLVPLAEMDYNYIKDKGLYTSKIAPHVYDWSSKHLYGGRTHSEVLEEAIAEK